MGQFPEVTPTRLPVALPKECSLADHVFEGKCVLPAVESMETLARAVREFSPDAKVDRIKDARFDRFLVLEGATEASADLAWEDGAIKATLLTRTKTSAITRTKIHATVTFPKAETAIPSLPLDMAAAPDGVCITVSPEDIYRDLVPFGPAYRNICAPLHISIGGAVAEIRSPELQRSKGEFLLGAPFVLDAAFHAACVWGQYFTGIVAFPMGIGERVILRPIAPGETCIAQVFPKSPSSDVLLFDIFIFDPEGFLCEAALDVTMRDPSGGRMKPPAWVQKPEDPLASLRETCEGLAVVELSAVAPFAAGILSPIETARFQKMGAKRAKGFLAGRVAIKRLFRNLREENWDIDPRAIETVEEDATHPCCRVGNTAPLPCLSLSHDSRFAVAVWGKEPIGVDVEVISDKALRGARLFMSETEQALIKTAPMGEMEAALRIWSAKEAVSKATGIPLAESWPRVEVTAVEPSESRFCIDAAEGFTAIHATVGTHLFTLFNAGKNEVTP